MKKCGVNKNLYKEYELEDHIWTQTAKEDLLHLANRCVKIDSVYWIKKIGGEHWVQFKNAGDAKKEAYNTWLGAVLPSNFTCSAELIKTFFDGLEKKEAEVNGQTVEWMEHVGSCPNISQKMVVPMAQQLVTYKQESYLNTWYDDMVVSDKENLNLGKSVLLMCYASLCSGVVDKTQLDNEADRIYQMVVNDSYDNLDFRFLMYWLAALVQNPGINLQTNIWLAGPVQGLGKGTIIKLMGYILGLEFVGELNQLEIEAGWNDHLIGLQLVEVNEFDTSSKHGWTGKQWNKWIKGHTIEPTLKIRMRNKTSFEVLHIGNFLGSTNSVDLDIVERGDRRNQFIKTTEDAYWVQYATAIQLKYIKKQPLKIASGFAFILDQTKVDMDFISKAHINQLKNDIILNDQNPIEEWVENDSTIVKQQWITASDLYTEFKTWWRGSHPDNVILSLIAFGKLMKTNKHLGIKHKRSAAAVQYMFDTAVDIVTHKLEDAVDTVNSITNDNEEIVVYDLDIVNEKVDPAALTPMQKMREQLRKQEEKDKE